MSQPIDQLIYAQQAQGHYTMPSLSDLKAKVDDIHEVITHHKTAAARWTFAHGVIFFSLVLNAALVMTLGNIYVNDLYFRLWFDTHIPVMVSTAVAGGAGIGSMVSIGVVLNGLRKRIVHRMERHFGQRIGVEV